MERRARLWAFSDNPPDRKHQEMFNQGHSTPFRLEDDKDMFDQWPLQRKAEQVTFVYLKLPAFHLGIYHSPQNLGGLERRSGKSVDITLAFALDLKVREPKTPAYHRKALGV